MSLTLFPPILPLAKNIFSFQNFPPTCSSSYTLYKCLQLFTVSFNNSLPWRCLHLEDVSSVLNSFHTERKGNIYPIYLFIYSEGALNVTVIVLEIGIGEQSSNPGCGSSRYTSVHGVNGFVQTMNRSLAKEWCYVCCCYFLTKCCWKIKEREKPKMP